MKKVLTSAHGSAFQFASPLPAQPFHRQIGDLIGVAAIISIWEWSRMTRAGLRRYLFVDGRLDDRLRSGGENIDPKEIEDFIERLPGANKCHVVGVPDPRLHEVPVAFVIPVSEAALPTEEEFIAMYRGKSQTSKSRSEYSSSMNRPAGCIKFKNTGSRKTPLSAWISATDSHHRRGKLVPAPGAVQASWVR